MDEDEKPKTNGTTHMGLLKVRCRKQMGQDSKYKLKPNTTQPQQSQPQLQTQPPQADREREREMMMYYLDNRVQ